MECLATPEDSLRAVLLTLLTWSAPALAGDDASEVHVGADGSIVGRMVLDLPESVVRAAIPKLNEPGWSSDVLSAELTPDGPCTGISRSTKGLWSPLKMKTRFCPTPRGWREYLVESDDYHAYEVEWTVVPAGARTEVRLTVKSDVNLAVPKFMVQSRSVSAVEETFKALLDTILGKGRKQQK